MTDDSDELRDAGRVRFEHKCKSVWRACSPVAPPHASPKRRVRSSLGTRPMPMLRRRAHKHGELRTNSHHQRAAAAAAAADAPAPHEDPYVRFITSVM